ncbi:MAG TPA: amidase [Fimbriimonadaceae bacterium]|nr:amidase [Fimbriimonadaceae bacterium]
MSELLIDRADLLKTMILGVVGIGPVASLATTGTDQEAITVEDLRSFAKVAGLKMSDEELNRVLAGVRANPSVFSASRKAAEDYSLTPPSFYRVPGAESQKSTKVRVEPTKMPCKRPASDEDLAFLTVVELGHLIRTKQISSLNLTKVFLDRLKTFGPKLVCVASLTEELALKQAAAADEELSKGKYRGLLHGIPYGIKDLFATKGYPTQWGTEAFRGQVIDLDATVVHKLRDAGAILVAKLSLGALAMNDNWYEGRTKNPWNPTEGSSGSSAGSASAVAAGLVPFAIGTETSGSIMSPSMRCRVTGLRPTFGSVSRHGAMCLSWTMDKVGPIARTAEDAALVFASLIGRDTADISSLDRSFEYKPLRDLNGMKIGVVGNQSQEPTELLRSLGAELIEIKVPSLPPGLSNILAVESAAMFDRLLQEGRLDMVKENDWATYWRTARFVPAVEYVHAERLRTRLIESYEAMLKPLDALLAASSGGALIYPSNLTGHPQIHIPLRPEGTGYRSFSLFGNYFQEAKLIAIANLIQRKTEFFRLRPDLSKLQ